MGVDNTCGLAITGSLDRRLRSEFPMRSAGLEIVHSPKDQHESKGNGNAA